MKKSLKPNSEEQLKRQARYDSIYELYKEKTLEELKEIFHNKELIKSSTDRQAINQLAYELFNKEKQIDKPLEIKENENIETTN